MEHLEISKDSREWKKAHTKVGKASQSDWAEIAKQIWNFLWSNGPHRWPTDLARKETADR